MSKTGLLACSNLASQTIDENGPGSILPDFEALLGFLEDGVPSSGKHHLLPMSRLVELDQRMTNPLRPRLKRPQQRSFPHLNGLCLLLRATQLAVAEGHGKASARLSLDADMHRQWLQLNATERYFNLLEAWLRRASWESVGLQGGGWMSQVAMSDVPEILLDQLTRDEPVFARGSDNVQIEWYIPIRGDEKILGYFHRSSPLSPVYTVTIQDGVMHFRSSVARDRCDSFRLNASK